MPGGNSEANKAEAYLAALRAGEEVKTGTIEVPVTPAEVARAAAIEAIKKVELPTTRDIGKILEAVKVAPAPTIEETPVDDGAVIINERIIEAPVMPVAPQSGMMEQPQQPWMGKDNRGGPSRGRELSTNEEEMQELASRTARNSGIQNSRAEKDSQRADIPQSAEVPTIAQQPQSGPVETPRVVEAPTSETPVPAPVETPVAVTSEEIMMPPEKYVPLMTEDEGPEQDGEHRAPQYGTSNQETLDATQKAYSTAEGADIKISSVQPEDVETSLAKGEKVTVPEPVAATPVVEKAPAPIVEAPKAATSAPATEAPKETPLVVETLKTPVVESAPKIASDDTKPEDLPVNAKNVAKAFGYMTRRSGEALASAMTGNEVRFQRHRWEREMEGVFQYAREKNLEDFNRLGSAGKRFVRSLYTSQPANAIRALGWRMSIEFNERIANYLGEKALVAGGRGELNEEELARTEKKHTAQKEELDAVAKRFGGVTPEIAKQIEAEEKARALETKGHKGAAESSRKEEQRFKGRENTFLERRNAAAEKLAAYVEKRLAPYEAKVEAIRTTKEKLDDEIGTFKEMRDKRQIERDRLIAEVAGMNMAAKPASIRMLYAKAVKDYEEELANAGELLDMKTAQRARVELQLADMNAQADKLRPKLSAIKEIPNRAKVSDRERAKVELPADPVDAEPSLEEALEVELPEARREKLPDMAPEDFIQKWNKFAGGDIPMDVGEFVAFMGVEKDAVTPVAVLQVKISGLFEAMLQDKGKRKRLREGVTREYIKTHLRSFIKTYLPMEAK